MPAGAACYAPSPPEGASARESTLNSDSTFAVIVTHWAAPFIRACIGSLAGTVDGSRIIVVDNASGDDTRGILCREFPQVTVLAQPENLGFGRANNVGIRLAIARGATQVLLLNQDAWVTEGCMARLLACLAQHPEAGVVSPLHCGPGPDQLDLKTLHNYLEPHFPEFLADACMGRVNDVYRGLGVNAAVWLVRREVWLQHGGFDPIFFMYAEDDDLLTRWRARGVIFLLVPGARAVHLRQSALPRRSSWRDRLRMQAQRSRSTLLKSVKQPGFSLAHALAAWVSVGVLRPLQELPLNRNLLALLADWAAAAAVLWQFATVRRHQAQCGSTGAHFLGEPPPAGTAESHDSFTARRAP